MVVPFSHTKLRIPKGFQSLLVGLSTEVLRNQPRDIHAFAADYFQELLQRRDRDQSYTADQQTSLEDRSYNNQSFQEEYQVNDPSVNTAATKIQAQFRGHLARRNLERKLQPEDQQGPGGDNDQEMDNEDQIGPEEVDEEEDKREQERAATSIQAQFRGFQVRKNLREWSDNANEGQRDLEQDLHKNCDKTPSPSTVRSVDSMENSTRYGEIDVGDKNGTNSAGLERESSQLSEDFEKHTQIPRDPNFDQEQFEDNSNDEDDMNDPSLDKAATRIQASYRGYKIRKELGSGAGPSSPGYDQQQPSFVSPPTHDNYDILRHKNILSPSAEGNKEPVGEEDDSAAAAVKIQAAYRGYRVRKDLDK